MWKTEEEILNMIIAECFDETPISEKYTEFSSCKDSSCKDSQTVIEIK